MRIQYTVSSVEESTFPWRLKLSLLLQLLSILLIKCFAKIKVSEEKHLINYFRYSSMERSVITYECIFLKLCFSKAKKISTCIFTENVSIWYTWNLDKKKPKISWQIRSQFQLPTPTSNCKFKPQLHIQTSASYFKLFLPQTLTLNSSLNLKL